MSKRVLVSCAVMALASSLVLVGCEKKATSASDAIQQAKTMQTPEQQGNYLVGQARMFLNSKQYQDAIQAAQYVLANVDANAQAAKDVLDKAKTQMAGAAGDAAKDAKKKLGL